jgi:hypothetical protein
MCKLGLFGTRGPLKRSFHSRFKLAQFTQERVKYNVFFFDEPLKGSLKIFRISLTFRFDKL